MSLPGLVIQAAQSQLEVIEKGGSDGLSGNIVPYWEWWHEKTGEYLQGQPWCAVFVSWCFNQNPRLAGILRVKNAYGFTYCPDLENWAMKHNLFVDPHHANPGDLVLFDFTGEGESEHVEIMEKNLHDQLQTIGGNTSSQENKRGSQANGGGVHRRKRPIDHTIRRVIRPPYPIEKVIP